MKFKIDVSRELSARLPRNLYRYTFRIIPKDHLVLVTFTRIKVKSQFNKCHVFPKNEIHVRFKPIDEYSPDLHEYNFYYCGRFKTFSFW